MLKKYHAHNNPDDLKDQLTIRLVRGGLVYRDVADGGDRLDDDGGTRVRWMGSGFQDGGWDPLSRQGDGGRGIRLAGLVWLMVLGCSPAITLPNTIIKDIEKMRSINLNPLLR